jgi:hypothetical protein
LRGTWCGPAPRRSTRQFSIDVGRLARRDGTPVAAALFIGGNMVDPEIKMIEHRVASTAASRSQRHTVQ